MPDESCRKCGGYLLNHSFCGKCKAPIVFICRICAAKTIERPHIGFCFMIDNNEELTSKIAFIPKIQN